MSDEQPAGSVSAEENIKSLEQAIYDADMARMFALIGELHTQWDSLTSERQADVLKLEAIFLSMLKARTNQ